MAVSPNGKRVFVTGYSNGKTQSYVTIAYNAATGARVWVQHYGYGYGYGSGSSSDYGGPSAANSVAASPTGGTVYVTGLSDNGTDFSSSNVEYATIAYNAATGAQQWVQRYGSSTCCSDNVATRVAVSRTQGTVFVTGIITGHDANTWATIAYRP
jgi:hypothetical protein